MSVLSVSQLSNFNVNDIKAQEKAEKKIAKAQEKITKEQEKAGKDGIITVKEEEKIAKAQERVEKEIAKAQEKGIYINQGADTVSISKEGLALSSAETKESNFSIEQKKLGRQRHEGEIRGKGRRKRREEEIASSLKRPVEHNDQGKKISVSAFKEDSANSINVNKTLSSRDPFRNFIGFLNLNDENTIFKQGGESVDILV